MATVCITVNFVFRGLGEEVTAHRIGQGKALRRRPCQRDILTNCGTRELPVGRPPAIRSDALVLPRPSSWFPGLATRINQLKFSSDRVIVASSATDALIQLIELQFTEHVFTQEAIEEEEFQPAGTRRRRRLSGERGTITCNDEKVLFGGDRHRLQHLWHVCVCRCISVQQVAQLEQRFSSSIQKYLKIQETVRERKIAASYFTASTKQVVDESSNTVVMMCLNTSGRQFCYANEMLTDLRHTFNGRILYRRSVGDLTAFLVKMISTRRIQLLFDKSVIFFGYSSHKWGAGKTPIEWKTTVSHRTL